MTVTETKLTESELQQFCGTDQWHRWSALFRNYLLSDGALHLAEKAGAYWLMDAIASHQPNALRRHADLRGLQIWTLTRNDSNPNYRGKFPHGCVLECRRDSNDKPLIVQRIEYTDFSLPSVRLYVARIDETMWCILLPSEN